MKYIKERFAARINLCCHFFVMQILMFVAVVRQSPPLVGDYVSVADSVTTQGILVHCSAPWLLFLSPGLSEITYRAVTGIMMRDCTVKEAPLMERLVKLTEH